ncbi:MAG: hypothetical protein K0Q50_1248 [Vampirovibrio sp.]|jgi:hypothetical protein|nr:hypothetical protein [Vampirovibrio sp.]
MTLHPHLVELLETYEPEHLSALLTWLEPEISPSANDTHANLTEQVDSLAGLEEETPMSNIVFIQASQAVLLNDRVAFTLLNEFGPNFSGKAYFHWLRDSVSQRIAQDATAQ